jgi:heterodisulfide reductase subunit A
MKEPVIVVGGGICGMTAAAELSHMGIPVTLIEKLDTPGGQVGNWDRLFPDRKKASEVLEKAALRLQGVNVLTGRTVKKICQEDGSFIVDLNFEENGTGMNSRLPASAIVLATGFSLFEARKKEEYGYGIYDNVMTSADLEKKFREGNPLARADGKKPACIGFVHCVGSRDEKVGNLYCSRVCCVTGVKQAIEVKEMFPDSEVFCFYMDLRMFGRHFEEMYYEAQQKHGIQFIRGRVSECAENPDGSVLVKTEDTLSGKPFKVSVDLLVLLSGITSPPQSVSLASDLGIQRGEDGFLSPSDPHSGDNLSCIPGIFLAGTVKGPASVTESIADGRAAAVQAAEFYKSLT